MKTGCCYRKLPWSRSGIERNNRHVGSHRNRSSMQFITDLVVVVLFAAALIAVFWAYGCFALLLARRVRVGAAALLIVYVAEAVFIKLPGIHLGLYLYPQDVVLSLLATAGLLRFFRLQEFGGRRMLLGIVFFLLLLSLGRGLIVFGAKLAGNESRSDFWFMAGLLYFASFHYDKKLSERIVAYWMKAAMALCALAVFRWTAMLLHLGITDQWSELQASFPMRVLGCSAGFFLLIAALMSAHFMSSGKATRLQRWVFYVSAPIAVMLQHRTVWVCGAISIPLFLAYTRRVSKQMAAGALALVLVAGVFGTIFVAERGADVQRSFGEAAQDSDDWNWRVSGWTSLWQSHFNDPVSILVGEPYGAGMGRYVDAEFVDVMAHNEYMQMALRIGVVGLICFVALYISSFWAVNRAKGGRAELLVPHQNFWRAWVVLSMAYCVTYSPDYDQSLLFGMLISLSSRATQPLLARALVPAQEDPAVKVS